MCTLHWTVQAYGVLYCRYCIGTLARKRFYVYVLEYVYRVVKEDTGWLARSMQRAKAAR